jgi:hypothetical protein
MPIYQVSQAERWHRIYTIEAASLEEAKQKYQDYLDGNETTLDSEWNDPEYLEDLEGDVEWYER